MIKVNVTPATLGIVSQTELSSATSESRHIPAFLRHSFDAILRSLFSFCFKNHISVNSARTLRTSLQPAPIRNVRKFVSIKKPGDVIEPWGSSPCISPAGREELGQFSKVPIHQSPRWFDGSFLPVPSFSNLSDGLSSYVGWLLNVVPFNVQFDKSWSSKLKMV